jgi:hypothetical protein
MPPGKVDSIQLRVMSRVGLESLGDGGGDACALGGQTTEAHGQSSADETAARLAQTPTFLGPPSFELHTQQQLVSKHWGRRALPDELLLRVLEHVMLGWHGVKEWSGAVGG